MLANLKEIIISQFLKLISIFINETNENVKAYMRRQR